MKILILEDEQGIPNFIQQGLEEEGYAVDTANNRRKGLDKALNKVYHLLLVDWMLPRIMGIAICNL